jgi:hypothetical protein
MYLNLRDLAHTAQTALPLRLTIGWMATDADEKLRSVRDVLSQFARSAARFSAPAHGEGAQSVINVNVKNVTVPVHTFDRIRANILNWRGQCGANSTTSCTTTASKCSSQHRTRSKNASPSTFRVSGIAFRVLIPDFSRESEDSEAPAHFLNIPRLTTG